ncbi:MAG: MBL fold metallo-hydrolase [Deltaproteobacteria bacterium]|nr:MBL fold metallo-hydrolase [Myxococcales bacterium]MDP3217156.1 MBL fold metallo-hydrolase [Deltaproteobacteria bacterium]
MSMKVKFWGVRGSIASPGAETALVGGNTSCVEVTVGETRLVLDAGTGLRALGNELMKQGPVDLTLLLSHVHWDHIQGLPFFAPLYAPGTRIQVVTGANGTPTREVLRRQMSAPTFPVDLNDVPAALDFTEVRDRQRFRVGEAEVTVARANHPDQVYAYRVASGGSAVVYATDTEHYRCVDPRLVALARDADVLIYDAQYLPGEYAGEGGMSRVGWGHSTWEAAVELARAAGVGRLVLFHHDPSRTDEGVASIEAQAGQAFGDVVAAREGMSIELGVARAARAA